MQIHTTLVSGKRHLKIKHSEANCMMIKEEAAKILLFYEIDPRGRPTITAGSDHYIHTLRLYVRASPLFKISQNKRNKTGGINDPLGQTHSLISSEHCIRLKFVSLR